MEEATALGTALLVAASVGLYPSVDDAIASTLDLTTVIAPIPDNVRAYEAIFERYVSIHDSFGGLY